VKNTRLISFLAFTEPYSNRGSISTPFQVRLGLGGYISEKVINAVLQERRNHEKNKRQIFLGFKFCYIPLLSIASK